MENHCLSNCKYHPEIPQVFHADDSPDDHGYPPYADDAQYFDIDISLPFSPVDTTPTSTSTSTSSSEEDDSEDEFELDFSISTINPPNSSHCISPPADNVLSYQSQLTPLKLPASPQSSNVPGVKIHFTKLLRTATRLKISSFGFRKSGKHGMDLQSPCAEYAGTGIALDTPVPKQNRFFTVKFKVVEVPLAFLFTRDNSKVAKRDDNNGFQKKSEDPDDGGQCKNMDRDRKRAKEIVQKYVKKIKPLYVKISQRCNEKIRLGDLHKAEERKGLKNGKCPDSERSEKQISFSDFSGNLKMVYKHLGKGKQQPCDMQQKLTNYSCESTMMEVQSAIQGAISHCKQSSYIDDTSNCPNFECSDES